MELAGGTGRSSWTVRGSGLAAGLLAIALAIAAFAPGASAAPPKVNFGSFCTTSGAAGGQCGGPLHGLAVNATGAGGVAAGSVYVSDASNNRIQQFSATGAFIRAFGEEVNETTGGDICTAGSGDVCQAGVAGEAAGALDKPYGVAVDQTTGAVYVSEQTSRRVDVFSAAGAFEGAIGWNVDSTSPAEELQFCTATTGCKAGVAGGAAGQFSNLKLSGVAVDPRDGDLYVADLGNLRLAEYAIATDTGGEVTGATFVRALGWKVDPLAPAEELQECTALTGCQAGSSGYGDGQFLKEGANGNPGPIAVDSNGSIYAVGSKARSCGASEPCRIQKFNPDGSFKEDFGPSSGECQLTYTSGTAAAQEAFDIAVDPVGADGDNHVFVAKKISATEYRVYEFDENGGECAVSPVGTPLAGAGTNSHGLAVGTGGRIYASNGTPEAVILGEAPAPEVVITEVSNVGADSATFVGEVTPPAEVEGQTFPTTWHFEYSTDQSSWKPVPIPDQTVASAPGVPEVVEESVSGLTPNTHYFVRLCATTSPTVCSTETEPPLEFTTAAIGPTVSPFSAEVTQITATLGAEINPNNLATRYHFEWATSSEWALSPGTYGHHTAAQEIAPGSAVVYAHEQLTGLAAASLYHFRVVATNSAGPTTSPDQQVETLNRCDFTDARCLELVSRADKGPLANPGKKAIGGNKLLFQAAPQGSELAYTVEGGYPDAISGDESLYLGRRGPSGWGSEEISPPASEPPVLDGGNGLAGTVKVLSGNLACGVVASPNLLTAESPPTVREAGGANLYRRDNATGAYQIITNLPPTEPPEPQENGGRATLGEGEYQVIGIAPDCERIVFRTEYRYPGIGGVAGAKSQLYEWNRGTLRNVAVIPGPGGQAEPVPVESIPGAMPERVPSGSTTLSEGKTTDFWRAVSTDASRSIFTAVSRFGGDAGNLAIYLRDAGDPGVLAGTKPAIDISQSETATANNGYARYQSATTDGGRIFFTARYGLAANGSSSGATICSDLPLSGTGQGCDLYEYNLAAPVGERLTDLSPDITDPRGAGVPGVLAASDDGTYVYFAARGRLGDEGGTEVQNDQAGAYNVYLAHAGGIGFVGSVGESEVLSRGNGNGQALIQNGTTGNWTSRSTPEGSLFAYESSLGVTGGAPMAYLYSAATDTTLCVSCRHDGRPSAGGLLVALLGGIYTDNENQIEQPTVLTENGRLYFYSLDPLATGAVEGTRNLYQWEHGQVSLVATEPVGIPKANEGKTGTGNFFAGASADGGDVYFATTGRLIPADPDERWDVYDARVGGGFPEPPPPAASCDAGLEGACNAGQAAPPAQTTPATPTFTGPGNPPAKHKHKKKHRKHHKKHRKHHKKHHNKKHASKHASNKKHRNKKTGKAGRANGDRRAGK